MKYPVEMIAPVSQRTPTWDKKKATASKSVQNDAVQSYAEWSRTLRLSQGSPFDQWQYEKSVIKNFIMIILVFTKW